MDARGDFKPSYSEAVANEEAEAPGDSVHQDEPVLPPPSYYSAASTSNAAARANYASDVAHEELERRREAEAPPSSTYIADLAVAVSLFTTPELRRTRHEWPHEPMSRVGEVFGFAVSPRGNAGPLRSIKVHAQNADVMYHFLWPEQISATGSSAGTLYMVPGPQRHPNVSLTKCFAAAAVASECALTEQRMPNAPLWVFSALA
ncbi:unnamed protein product [Parajaminaea phylloscopi]